ncbi:glycosyltransferase family 4 protein [Paenibacillus alginolyticus]|uniref:Glycosyltransferase family 4 protein n=1 Tax=Paenibacillus alginolyticus TaxID=59839 RepID=A0ABT4GE34_9BACL|nr:glycosyltransferase family 4 protein [Paenibacillus alginolyticus]MCY9694374.1 glycosyltransferase family 4 protein [Paenibacillus alginolyticus]MEC0147543.1 glycosyltransferase family 4 protein [Paenibacillus alginolyticus]
MRILLATHWLIPHVGGVWAFMEQLKNRLEALGHVVDLLGNSPDYLKFHIVNRNQEIAKAHFLPMLETKLSASNQPHLSRSSIVRYYELERYCMELSAAYFGLEQYDLIHTQDVLSTRSISRVKPRHTAHVAHIHGCVATEMMLHYQLNPYLGIGEHSPEWKYFRSLEHYGASSCDITVTSTHWMRNLLVQEFGVPSEQITVFQYGFDSHSFAAKIGQGTPVQRPVGKKVIICPARLVFIKGINVLISALAKLKEIRQDWVCWIVGDGDMRETLEQLSFRLGLQGDVFFLGRRDDVPALLHISDIFVHPCLQDNQPYSVVEAQFAGLPAVVSNGGGLPEMVENGKTGLVSPVGDPDSLCANIASLLQNDAYRKELGDNAKVWAQSHWSMDQMVNRVLEVYEKAMKKV